jgi:hypothetical protein
MSFCYIGEFGIIIEEYIFLYIRCQEITDITPPSNVRNPLQQPSIYGIILIKITTVLTVLYK